MSRLDSLSPILPQKDKNTNEDEQISHFDPNLNASKNIFIEYEDKSLDAINLIDNDLKTEIVKLVKLVFKKFDQFQIGAASQEIMETLEAEANMIENNH